MNVLESIHPVSAENRDEWLTVRIRLASTIATIGTEISGAVSAGLAGLDDIRLLLPSVSDPLLRADLSGRLDHNFALLLMAAGRNEDSIAYFDSSLRFRQTVLDASDDPVSLLDPYLGTLVTRGLANTRLGDVRQAREDLTRAMELAELHGLRSQAADARRPLGSLELRVGDVPSALKFFGESERIYRSLDIEVHPLLRLAQAQALLTAGLAEEAGGHLDEVLPAMLAQRSISRDLADVELYRASAALMSDDLELARSHAASARRRMLRWGCQTCVANATIVGLRADVQEALRTNEIPPTLTSRALRAANGMPMPRLADQAALARMLAVRVELRKGKRKRAAELLARIPQPGRLTSVDYRMLRRLCRAELAVAEGDKTKALAEIRAGLTELDRVRDRMGGIELVSGTALHGRELADLAVKIVLERADAARLFGWTERTRAQSYRYEPVVATDPELAERVGEVRGLDQAIHQAQHEGHPTAALRAKHAERLREAHRLGWHTGRWGRPRPVARLAEVAQELGERALVSFASSGDDLVAMVVVGGRCELVRLGSAARAAESARMLNVDLDALAPDQLPAPLVQSVLGSARKQAERLDIQLIRPLEALLGDRGLIVVPTGPLFAVPWGVLPALRSRPIVVAPSATAWLGAARSAVSRARKVVLVRGPGLVGTRGELDKLAMHYRTAHTLAGAEATVSSVLRALDGAKLAHIAAHGAHEPENALFSRLELADGALFAHEMAGLAQPPSQVVFAACELALNRIRPGDEVLGFASGLLASGSRTVIAPLSRVGDEAAAAAMDDYHRGLAGGDGPATALADTIAVDPFRRPFVCLGAG
ncbi:CHAT domain-containing protein [Amycolatopsis keratiniphila]|uniref:CHAT domain-containing protein n=1 Tax=Amycolatopsis keratiniphila TaxID=129921 RepID=UPI00087B3209|nr:CHAT domain-containing protein [Amycolatopsis keratiniphila]SDU46430.1 CHAT domain-containing protein [Amycolatopsis keratiniphila]